MKGITVGDLKDLLKGIHDDDMEVLIPGHDHSYNRVFGAGTTTVASTPTGYYEFFSEDYLEEDEIPIVAFVIGDG